MSIVYDLQDSLEVQLMKEGLKISEDHLMKMLGKRNALVRELYSNPITEAGFKRAKAEEEMIKLVASYNVSVENLLEVYVKELQSLRQSFKAIKQENEDLRFAIAAKSSNETTLLNLMMNGYL